MNSLATAHLRQLPSDRQITSSRVWLDVSDVMSRNVTVISPETTLLAAAQRMSEKQVSSIVVVDDDSQMVGLLTEKDFLRSASEAKHDFSATSVSQVMSCPVHCVAPSVTALGAGHLMEEKGIKRLPVLQDGELVGIVTQTDLVRGLTSYGLWRDVGEIMSTDVIGIQRQAKVAEAAQVMTRRNISCIVVLEGQFPVGVLTEKDFLKRVVARQKDPRQIEVDEVMSSPCRTVPPSYSVFSASKAMSEMNVRRLVVMQNYQLYGIVAQTDVFRAVRTKLQREEEEYHQALERSDSAIFTTDLEANATYVNHAFIKLLEVENRDELINQPFLPDRFWRHSEERSLFMDELTRGEICIKEVTLTTARDDTRFITVLSTPVKGHQGEICGRQGILYDITEKKELATLRETQEALMENERRYRLLAENAKDVIWTSDLNLRWTYFSPSMAYFRGFTAEETLRQDLSEVLTPTSVESAMTVLFLELEQARIHHDASTRVRTLELEFICKDGSTVWGDVKVSFLCDEAGDPIGLVGVIRDITDRRRQEEELRKYATALKSANESLEQLFTAAQAATTAKNELFANLSHEIRTPMTAILGYADVLADKLIDSEHAEAIDIIRRNGQYLLKIIDDILDISKIEAGKLQVEEVAFSPIDLLSEVVSLLRVRASIKNLTLDVQYEGSIPALIRTDPTRLRQVLINLVANAIKFTESGHVRILVGLTDEKDQQPWLRFDVVDTGIGIAPERVGALFQPFTQVDASSHRRFGGTGLGLTISRRLAKMMGGDISVDSAVGKGSTFRLTVATGPLQGTSMLEPAAISAKAVQRNPQADVPKTALECRVLLAEDGRDNQRLISFLLKKAGVEVVLATNGKIAVEKALSAMPGQGSCAEQQAPEFSLILMDMQMPIMDGYEATRLLRQEGYTGPIVALTAHAMKHDRQNCLDAGCDDYLSKPIDRNTLLATVARFAEAHACSATDA